MSDAVLIAWIGGGAAVVAAPFLAVVNKKLNKIKETGDATHLLTNNNLTAANTKIDVRDATIASLQAQLLAKAVAQEPPVRKRKSPRK